MSFRTLILLPIFSCIQIELPSDGQRTTWTVKEDSLQGTCENTYEINELPEYVIKENPELIPMPSQCPTHSNNSATLSTYLVFFC